MTSTRKDMLANRKLEEERKRGITGERGRNVWINKEVESSVSIKLECEVNKNASPLKCIGRVRAHSCVVTSKVPLKSLKLELFWGSDKRSSPKALHSAYG